jgi:hypothetical protein
MCSCSIVGPDLESGSSEDYIKEIRDIIFVRFRHVIQTLVTDSLKDIIGHSFFHLLFVLLLSLVCMHACTNKQWDPTLALQYIPPNI